MAKVKTNEKVKAVGNFKLNYVYFKKLKGLEDVKIVFTKPLTAIIGVNGCGKTTIIHALACAYQPTDEGHGENHRFPEFFIPNTDALWQGSEFTIENEKKNSNQVILKTYKKSLDRWMPSYDSRPRRNVYYIGIDTCLHEIEKKTTLTRISYSSMYKNDDQSTKVINTAGGILNIPYKMLLENTFKKKHFNGVELDCGLKYSSLSMGTGEQRTIKILRTVLNAEKHSLILIDEIDLLLHISALRALIKELYKIAKSNELQIIFTTHSLEMANLTNFVGIQYLYKINGDGITAKSFVYDSINTDLIYNLIGECQRPLKIFVEDNLAKCIINQTLRIFNMKSKADVIIYGSASNAFTIAAAEIIKKSNYNDVLVVLDGDVYSSDDEKEKQINRKLSGNEQYGDDKRKKALSLIKQFNLLNKVKPEEFFFGLLKKYVNKEDEIYKAALNMNAVNDSHDWINKICIKLNESEEILISKIISFSKESEEWQKYIQPIGEWLESKKSI